jgi:hypothetical protein
MRKGSWTGGVGTVCARKRARIHGGCCALALYVVVALAPVSSGAQRSTLVGEALARDLAGRSKAEVRTSSMFDGYFVVESPSYESGRFTGLVEAGRVRGRPVYEGLSLGLDELREVRVRDGSRWMEGLGLEILGGLVFAGLLQEACQTDDACEPPRMGYPAFFVLSAGASAASARQRVSGRTGGASCTVVAFL